MSISYNRLWKLLVDKNMSKADLRKIANISPNTMTKMRRNEFVSLEILCKICGVLDCDFCDIIEYIKPNLKENQ
ncbi:MAG: helix-turn-helix transcriptional regulator [Ruminococcus sp.]|nr:helix-turn-helix transcriptional regulator [Ruminococcus sp.]